MNLAFRMTLSQFYDFFMTKYFIVPCRIHSITPYLYQFFNQVFAKIDVRCKNDFSIQWNTIDDLHCIGRSATDIGKGVFNSAVQLI